GQLRAACSAREAAERLGERLLGAAEARRRGALLLVALLDWRADAGRCRQRRARLKAVEWVCCRGERAAQANLAARALFAWRATRPACPSQGRCEAEGAPPAAGEPSSTPAAEGAA
ncbi:unnamed protein product, partial [Prorocentrum cordatum]